MTVSLNFYPLKANINTLVQSIERSLHLIYENLFSIKQYQFPSPPPKKKKEIGLNLFKESRRTSPLCVRRRLRLYIYPRRPEVMVGRYRECRAYCQVCGQRGRNLTMTMASSAAAGVLNTVSDFLWLSGTDEEKVDPDKSVVFTYRFGHSRPLRTHFVC